MQNLVTALIAIAVLWILKRRTEKREEKMSEGKFLIKLSSGYFFLGAIEAGIGMALLLWCSLETGSMGITVMLALASMPGFLLMILPLSGMWEIFVNYDSITVTKFFS